MRFARYRGRASPRRPIVLALLTTVVVVSLVAALLRAGMPGSEAIRIGGAFNTTGGMKWLDGPALAGFQLAADELNRSGGVLGRRVEVVTTDGTTDGTRSVDGVVTLIEEQVVAIGGLNEPVAALAPRRRALRRADGGLSAFSHSELARRAAPPAAAAGVPVVTSSSTRPGLTDEVGPYLFALTPDTHALSCTIARFAHEDLGAVTTWVLEGEDNAFTRTVSTSFRAHWRDLGGRVTATDTYRADLRLTDQLARLTRRRRQPDVLFLAALPSESGMLVDQIRAAGLRLPVISADWLDLRYLTAYAGDHADDVYVSTSAFLASSAPAIRSFTAAYRTAYGHEPEGVSALLGYDTLRLLADAIERAGSTEPEAIRGALARTDRFRTSTGTLRYPVGQRTPSGPVMVVRVRDGEPQVVAGPGDAPAC